MSTVAINRLGLPFPGLLRWVEPLSAALLYVAVICALVPWWSVYAFDPDEGINLMKAALVAEGYALYSEIWNDQPPVFTWLLVPLQWFGESVVVARALVLGFAAWIVATLFAIVRRGEGSAAAWIAVIAVMGAGAMTRTSMSVLIGLPALAFAFAGLHQAMIGGARWRFALAGLLFAVALQTKLNVALLLPAFALAAFAQSQLRRGALDLAVLLGSMAVGFLAIAFVAAEPIFSQMLQPHTEAAKAGSGINDLLSRLSAWPLWIGGAIGFAAVAVRPSIERSLPIVWLATAFAVFTFHHPLHNHHLLMLAVPLAWLTGIGASLLAITGWPRIAAVVAAALLCWPAADNLADERRFSEKYSAQKESPMRGRHRDRDRWVLADFLIDAYLAGRLVPPELAVFSFKRIDVGALTFDTIREAVRTRQPTEVYFRRIPELNALRDFLVAEGYVQASRVPHIVHYVRRASADPPPPLARISRP